MRIRCFAAVEPGWSYYRDLLPHLARQGHEVEIVITGSRYREQAGGSFASLMAEQGVSVHVVHTARTEAGRGAARVALYLKYVLTAMRRSLFGPAVDVNFFLTQPPFFFLWGLVLKLLRGQRYVVVLMDLYPDVLTASGIVGARTPHARLAGWLARLTHRHAAAVVVIGRCMGELMVRRGVHPARIHLAPNWSNADVRPVRRLDNPLRAELGIGDRFVVMYSGNMGIAHTFDDVIEVARRMRHDDGVRFVFAGGGRRRAELERARSEGLENLVLLPFQPVDRLAHSLALGDVHFVSLRAGFEGLMVPSKAYSVLEAGRGLIYQGTASGEIARLVAEEDVGAVVPLDDADGLERAIRGAMQDPNTVAAWGLRAEALAERLYSRASALQRYAQVFAALSARPSDPKVVPQERAAAVARR
jgi:glycosyltransferase involved in cell wall biosynthesis